MVKDKNGIITRTVEAAVKILEKNPHLKYLEAVEEAKKRIAAEERGTKHWKPKKNIQQKQG